MLSNTNVLMVAFHYPPCAVSSGVHRTVYFANYLKNHSQFLPHILTVKSSAHAVLSGNAAELAYLPHPVVRTFAPDAARHLSIFGKYPGRFAIPDRWRLWKHFAMRPAYRAIRQSKIKLIWSTYPIATSHEIASALARRASLPWIADLRDPMVEYSEIVGEWYPSDARLRASRQRVERLVMEQADFVTVCSPASRRILLDRYGDVSPHKIVVIPNGFDDSVFPPALKSKASETEDQWRKVGERIRILHSGTLYGGATRDASEFLDSIRKLTKLGGVVQGVDIRLRGTGNDKYYSQLVAELGLERVVDILPQINHQSAVREMQEADVLLLLQGQASNSAIPAKTYEYIALKKPILAIVGADGDTARVLQDYPLAYVIDVANEGQLVRQLEKFFERLPYLMALDVDDSNVNAFSRARGAKMLLEILQSLLTQKG